MIQSSIRLSESYVIPQDQRAELAKASQYFGHAQPSPDELGGYFDFVDWRGEPVTNANFFGRWSFLYFGYSRCQGSCQGVVPMLADAAAALRARGFAAKATFVDIESSPVGAIEPVKRAGEKHVHGSNWDKRYAMAKMALAHGKGLDVLTGSRFQISQATTAFHVLREHVPPRSGETNLSINHSSIIYIVGPDTLVAGYGYHDMGSAQMVALVEQLSKAPRSTIDLAAIRRRYIRGACGE